MPSPLDSDTPLDAVLVYSRYAQRVLNAEPDLRADLEASRHQAYSREEMLAYLASQLADAPDNLNSALRALRKRVMLRLIVRDLCGAADLSEVMHTISALAEVAIETALRHLDAALRATWGTPIGEESGAAQSLIVVAMGKLGGGELNVSSDIDLIYVYPEDGHTDHATPRSNHEYFSRLGQKLSAALSEITAEGYVFRVDLRLRPYGESGPLVSSFAMLEQYFITQGREWERYAWIKARALSGDAQGLIQRMRPFVYRKYLDFGAIASMRELHAQVRREVLRRDLADNIKLGPGGIREIEFLAQVFQLIRGGKEAALQARPTRAILNLLGARQLLPATTVSELQTAYEFLRRLEHRLQYLDDAQTQTLPNNETDQALIAQAMGHAEWEAFLQDLNQHRNAVDRHFQDIFAASSDIPDIASAWNLEGEAAEAALYVLAYDTPEQAAHLLLALKQSRRYAALPAHSRARLDALMPRVITEAAQHGDALLTLTRILALIEAISQRESYLALLAEYPETLSHVARLCAASPWAADYLKQHPLLLDELLDRRTLLQGSDWPTLTENLRRALDDFPDTERQMDTLRHFKHAQTFHLLAQDLEGLLALETLSDELSALAEIILREVLRLAWDSLPRKHREAPRFAIIAYGKLGGKELGYASDLDMVMLYDDDDTAAPENYARLAQRINTWLTTLTPAGVLYETDLRLRPDGAAGLLVSSRAAFEHYQREKAWVWEHQALTRARFVAGDTALGEQFEAIRRGIICMRRDPRKLAAEVLAMRQKMRDAHPNHSDSFDLKHDPGGIIDVEFIVQYLVLAHAADYPALADNVGNLALLARAADAGLIAIENANAVRAAYREFRTQQHRIRLQGESRARIMEDAVARHRDAVLGLWAAVF